MWIWKIMIVVYQQNKLYAFTQGTAAWLDSYFDANMNQISTNFYFVPQCDHLHQVTHSRLSHLVMVSPVGGCERTAQDECSAVGGALGDPLIWHTNASLWIYVRMKDHYCGISTDMLHAFWHNEQQHNSIDYSCVQTYSNRISKGLMLSKVISSSTLLLFLHALRFCFAWLMFCTTRLCAVLYYCWYINKLLLTYTSQKWNHCNCSTWETLIE